MNILLINLKMRGFSRSVTTPLGLLSIACSLQNSGHSVRIYDRTVDSTSAEKVFSEFRPDITGISMISYKSYSDAVKMCALAKKNSCLTVIGGPLPSEIPDEILEKTETDIVSIGEGEATWSELAECFAGGRDYKTVSGIAYKENGRVVRTEDRPFIDLASLPDTDWSLIDVKKYFQRSFGCKKMLYLYSAKGCPNDCTFCYNKSFHKCTYRKRPTEALLKEIRFLTENYGMDGVYFADEIWCRNRTEMKEMCDAMREFCPQLSWGCQTRIGFFTKEDFEYMYDCGCRWVFFGIESGSPEILGRMHKHIPYEKIVPTVNACHSVGIATIVSFILGFPGETEDEFRQTIDLAKQFDTPLVNCNYYIAIPGSDMCRELVESGKYRLKELSYYEKHDQMESLLYNFSSVPDRELRAVRAYFMWNSFATKDASKDSGSFAFMIKVVLDAMKGMLGDGPVNFFRSFIYAAVSFLRIFFAAKFHPRIMKKYNLK